MRRAEVVTATGLPDDWHLEFGTVAEVVVIRRVAETLAVVLVLASFGQGLKAELESTELTTAKAVRL
ncbi:hypothetical protein [Kribbella sp. VKM Ac-2571]|uniref:hypothetical protein n=1 Tax=Kribbella sp. VKM Ac-2571 TaxID=2512222 RepID=UPI0010601918|nr:hypothetical protein [Kribbella sp. VKM Ac-2571]